ncbi:MAG: hypothetical protein H0V49_08595 [Nocardioidaceae bacterium]|nr:hypothetical protein [Nocardioidaceae bacterium]
MKRLLGLAIPALFFATATPASAGFYDVKACYSTPGGGWIGNYSWAADVPGPYATAYTACPGEGIVTRMSGANDGSRAPYGAGARHVFTAPPGTHVARFRANVNQSSFRGWYAGLVDSSPRWIWCGNACTTWGQYWWTDVWMHTPQLMAQVTCGDFGGCPRWNLDGLMTMRDVIVTVEDTVPPGVSITGGSVTAGGWRNSNQDVHYSAWDSTGIRAVEVFVDGQLRGRHAGRCSDAAPRPCDDLTGAFALSADMFGGDGGHTVLIKAFDGAWNPSETMRDVLIDRSAPAQPIEVELVGQNGWRAQNLYKLRWRNPPQDASPIVKARYAVCPSANSAAEPEGCEYGSRNGHDLTALTDLRVPRPGDWNLSLWLEDEAGNADPERSVSVRGLRFDDTPPTLGFAVPRDSDPTRVRVLAEDTTSGIATGQIEARRRGDEAWRSLPTTLGDDGFSALLDDEALPKGEYELRARATDMAANERSTQSQKDGQPALRKLPLRISTRLAVGRPTRVRARGANGKRQYRTVLIVRPRARYGRTIPLRGRLTTPGANPLAEAEVEVWEQTKLRSAPWRRIGLIRTSLAGSFRFKALRGPSRLLRFRYPGTATIQARSTEVDLRVRAVTSLKVTDRRVVNGEEIRFSGRLKGRQTAETGKLIHLQVYTRGRWSTFATPRASRADGRWRLPYRFSATRGVVRYRFRALVPREASFPYETGVSHSVKVLVRGL